MTWQVQRPVRLRVVLSFTAAKALSPYCSHNLIVVIHNTREQDVALQLKSLDSIVACRVIVTPFYPFPSSPDSRKSDHLPSVHPNYSQV